MRRRLLTPGSSLAGITLLALVLRLLDAGARLSDAEGYSWLVAHAPSFQGFLDRLAAYENTPPLFYALSAPFPARPELWVRIVVILAGALTPAALCLVLARPFGRRAALLAALVITVAPYHVSYSDYARGFVLAGLFELVFLAAAVRILAGETRRRWLLAGAAAGVLAVWSEYYALGFLAIAGAALLVLRPRAWRRTTVLCAVPALSLLPWIHQFHRAQAALDVTKSAPVFPGPSPGSLRDTVVALVFGEHGAGSSAAFRWVQFLLIIAALIALVAWATPRLRASARRPWALLLTVALGVLALHAVLHQAGVAEIFNQRYLTLLIALAAAVTGIGLATLPRPAWRLALAAALLVGLAVGVQRAGREYEPDFTPVARSLETLGPRLVLTNSAVIAYDLPTLRVRLDRPFDLGRGRPCPRGCIVIEDARVPGGLRPGMITGRVGPWVALRPR